MAERTVRVYPLFSIPPSQDVDITLPYDAQVLLAPEYGTSSPLVSAGMISDFHLISRLPSRSIGMIVDRGRDFPGWIQHTFDILGADMWMFRDQPNVETTKAVNIYRGDTRE